MAGLFKKNGLAGDRLLKSWHQQIEGLRLRLGSSKNRTCDALCRDDRDPGIFRDPIVGSWDLQGSAST